MATADYDNQAKKVDEINTKLEDAIAKQTKIDEKIAKSNLQYQTSVDKVTSLKGKIDELTFKNAEQELKSMQAEANRVEASTKKIGKATNENLKQAEKSMQNIQQGISGAIGKLGKMALAVLSIRSAYMLVRQASSTLGQYDKQYAADLEYIRYVIAQGIAPVLRKVVELAQTLMAYINYLVQKLFGVNLFANASAKAFKSAKDSMSGMAKSSKELKNNLASFDELNVLNQDNGAGGEGALLPSMDIGGLEDVEIPEWLQKIAEILEPVTTKIQELLGTLGETLGGAITELTKLASSVSKTFQDIWNRIAPVIAEMKKAFLSFYNSAIKPVFDTTKRIILDLWQGIKDAWDKWGQPIWENLKTAVLKVGEVMINLWNNILYPVWQKIIEVVGELWDNHLKPLWDNLLDFFGEVINGALEIWNKTLEPFVNWFINTFGDSISTTINMIIEHVGIIVGAIVDVVNAIIRSLKGVVEFVVGVFTGDWEKAWQGIKDFFGGIWDGIVAIVKGAINLIINFINGMIAGIEKALNWIADKINDLRITNPFDGEEIWSPHIPKFDFGRIPKLAQGGIVAQPTHAIIGEAGREAIMPLESNTEWMDELASRINAGGNITIRFTGTTAQLVRMLKPEIDKEDKRTGKRLIAGGAY